jgi:hypothetical protein
VKKLRPFRIAFLAAILLAAVATSTKAATISYTTSTPIPSTLTDWSGSLAFQQFDPSLGVLNSVTLQLSGSLSTIVSVLNNSPSGSSGTAKTEVQMTVQDPGLNFTPNVPQLDLISPAFGYSLSPGGSATSTLLTKSGAYNSAPDYTLPAVLTEFTGLGTITLSASTFTQTLLANTGGNTAATQLTDAALTGSVTYNYTAVPEPSTFALLGAGIIGLIYGWRRRK